MIDTHNTDNVVNDNDNNINEVNYLLQDNQALNSVWPSHEYILAF